MRAAIYAFYEQLFHRLLPSHTAIVIAEWITAKEEYEDGLTSISFIKYQDATTTLLNDEDARTCDDAITESTSIIRG